MADDLAAVIEQTGLERPLVAAWSYGGFVVADYLRAYGDEAIAAINLVGAAVLLKPPGFDHLGPGLLENANAACASDLATNIAALRRFLRACTARELDEEAFITTLGWNMAVPSRPRGPDRARARRRRRPGDHVGAGAGHARTRGHDRPALDG